MPDRTAYRGALEAVDRILNHGGDTQKVLRAVAETVLERTGFEIVAIRPGGLDVDPAPDPGDGEARAFLDRVAVLVSAHAVQVPSFE